MLFFIIFKNYFHFLQKNVKLEYMKKKFIFDKWIDRIVDNYSNENPSINRCLLSWFDERVKLIKESFSLAYRTYVADWDFAKVNTILDYINNNIEDLLFCDEGDMPHYQDELIFTNI